MNHPLVVPILVFAIVLGCGHQRAHSAGAADRNIAVALSEKSSSTEGNVIERVGAPEAGAAVDAWTVAGWKQYVRLWNELAADPENPSIRRYLGLPIGAAGREAPVPIKSARGRSAPRWLGWKTGSYRQYETPHLQLFSRASDDATRQVAADLEQVYWVWTQLFYPLWDGQPQVALHLEEIDDDRPVASVLQSDRTRLASRGKMRVVLYRDADDYARSLGQVVPGIERSTGFYSDERLTSFFYPSATADARASRRHELVHQLFREATRSRRADVKPGERADFWIVEGIAGYFESLSLSGTKASVGGWDSPRLQFARYRVLAMRDLVTLDELRRQGRAAAQRNPDLARWYAFSIAYCHALLDGESNTNRRWVYQLLASLYDIPLDIPDARPPANPERLLNDFLTLDDAALRDNPATREIRELCLAGCEVSAAGLRTIETAADCTWIDLSRLPLGTSDVTRLCPSPERLDQLSLEATQVDDQIAPYLSRADRLRELDLSWTRCGDATLQAIDAHAQLETLWLTGTAVTDAAVPLLVRMRSLRSLDVQRTQISDSGLTKLRQGLPAVELNPLQLRVQ